MNIRFLFPVLIIFSILFVSCEADINLQNISDEISLHPDLIFPVGRASVNLGQIITKREKFKKILDNEFYNALQVKFAYAVTCHKAQGGQWKKVFIDPGQVSEDQINSDFYRWLYTALTRATENVFLINFPNTAFEPQKITNKRLIT